MSRLNIIPGFQQFRSKIPLYFTLSVETFAFLI